MTTFWNIALFTVLVAVAYAVQSAIVQYRNDQLILVREGVEPLRPAPPAPILMELDGTATWLDGRVIFFSRQRFASDVAQGGACMICGADRNRKQFNDEHILPDWILRRYQLHGSQVRLPNNTMFTYGKYKIACCVECNTLMGDEIENPMSRLTAGGAKAVLQHLRTHGTRLLINWPRLDRRGGLLRLARRAGAIGEGGPELQFPYRQVASPF